MGYPDIERKEFLPVYTPVWSTLSAFVVHRLYVLEEIMTVGKLMQLLLQRYVVIRIN
jgi:hypothetical protein